jgi:L-serine dehydratase
MDISIFDIIGPIMIGPSSSHTAGAAKLARVAAAIVNKPFMRVEFGLHGSFSKTGLGHGTDKALLAGVMGIREDDRRIREVYGIASERGLQYNFYEIDLGDVHENSVRIVFFHTDGTESNITGSSIGGGRIIINDLNGFKMDVSAEQPTLVVRHYDKKGVLNNITQLLSREDINIGVLRLTREEKGGEATTIIETDSEMSAELLDNIKKLNNIIEARLIRV